MSESGESQKAAIVELHSRMAYNNNKIHENTQISSKCSWVRYLRERTIQRIVCNNKNNTE
jgi:hypothetical protein